MQTHELLFELSHPIRYFILKLLSNNPLRLTRIGEQVDSNNPEVSRHLERLKTAGLIEKNQDGTYQTSSVGTLLMTMVPGISFIAAHNEFFLDHDLSSLPAAFVCRLGELVNSRFLEGTTANVLRLDQVSKESKREIYTISNEKVRISEEKLEEFDVALASDIHFQVIIQESQLTDESMVKVIDRCGVLKDDHFRVIPHVPMFCSIMDDEAMVAFLDRKGKTDFSMSLWTMNPLALQWCKDLFFFIWDQGKPVSDYE